MNYRRRDDWIDDDEYPDDSDVEAFGEGSPPDNDPLTIGYVASNRPRFWTTRRIVALIFAMIIIGILLANVVQSF